jgi:hypothetical protein
MPIQDYFQQGTKWKKGVIMIAFHVPVVISVSVDDSHITQVSTDDKLGNM